jgi:hypothetical protein
MAGASSQPSPFSIARSEDTDARDKCGHDQLGWQNQSGSAHCGGTVAEAMINHAGSIALSPFEPNLSFLKTHL